MSHVSKAITYYRREAERASFYAQVAGERMGEPNITADMFQYLDQMRKFWNAVSESAREKMSKLESL